MALTVVYLKGKGSEAVAATDAIKLRFKRNPLKIPVHSVCLEQLKDWNSTVSNLHASLVAVHSVAMAKQIDPLLSFVYLLQTSPHVLLELLNTLLCLRELLLESPGIAELGYQLSDSELLTLLATVCMNMALTPTEYTSLNTTLTGIILGISEEKCQTLLLETIQHLPDLNG